MDQAPLHETSVPAHSSKKKDAQRYLVCDLHKN